MKKADLSFKVRRCGSGSPYSVSFILQVSSGKVFHFTGRPDFSINTPFWGTIAQFNIKEVQSPQGRRRESKTAALSQAGVYAVGQLTKEGSPHIMPAIVLHKDKSAQVAMASVDPAGEFHWNSVFQAGGPN